MASTIKGITVEIGGNTQPLEKSLEQVNKTARDLSGELRVIDKLLKLDPTNTSLLAQKQKVLAESIKNTSEKLEKLKTAQEQARAQLERGEIGEAQYRALERQVISTEQALDKLQTEARETDAALDAAGDEAQEFGQKTNNAAGEADGFSKKSAGAFAAVAAAVTAAVAAISQIVSKLHDAALASAGYADDINTMAAQYRISTESLQKFAYAADIVDVSVETFGSSLGRLTRAMGQAQKGTKDQVQAFDALGVSIYDNNGNLRDSEDVFYDIIDALGQFEDETQADIYAQRLFGRSFQDLNPLVAAGTDKLRELGDEAMEVGAVMGQDALDSANAFQDSLDRMGQLTQVATRAFSSGMTPALDRIATSINEELASPDTQKKLEQMGSAIGAVAEAFAEFAMFVIENGGTILKVIASIAAGFAAWKIASIMGSIISAVQNFATSFVKAGGSIIATIKSIDKASMATIIGVIITVIGLVATLADEFLGASQEAKNFKDSAEALNDTAQSLTSNYEGNAAILQANADNMRTLAKEIQDLDSKIKSGSLSSSDLAEAQGELAAKTVKYNAAAGEEILQIDKITGAIEGSTDALGANTEALIKNAKKAAEVKALEEAYTTQSEALGALNTGLDRLIELYPDLSEAQQGYIDQLKYLTPGTQKYNEVLTRLQYASGWVAAETGDLGEAMQSNGGVFNQVNNEVATLAKGMYDSGNAWAAAGEAVEYHEGVVRESTEAEAEYTNTINSQTEAVANLTDQEALRLLRMQENGTAIDEEQARQLEAYKANNAERYAAMEELVAKEQEYQQARIDTVVNANGRIELANDVSFEKMNADLLSREDTWTQYEADLAAIREIANANMNEGERQAMLEYVETLTDGSADSMSIARQLHTDLSGEGAQTAWDYVNNVARVLHNGKPTTDAEAYALGYGMNESTGEGEAANDKMQTEFETAMQDTIDRVGDMIGENGPFYWLGIGIINRLVSGMRQITWKLYETVDNIVANLKSKFTFEIEATATSRGGRVRGFATGGVVWKEEIVRVAENGPEAIIPLNRLAGVVNGILSGRINGGGNTSSSVYFQPKIELHAQKVTDAEAIRLSKVISREFAKATGGRMN